MGESMFCVTSKIRASLDCYTVTLALLTRPVFLLHKSCGYAVYITLLGDAPLLFDSYCNDWAPDL